VERYARVYEAAGVAGWLTTAGNKPGMVSRMGALLVEAPDVCNIGWWPDERCEWRA
jgi:hypothetical protein